MAARSPAFPALSPPLSDREWKALVHERIPNRMRELHLCAQIAHFESVHKYAKDGSLRLGTSLQCEYPTSRWISYPIIDGGLILCRVMLEFLGIRSDKKGLALCERTERPHADDIYIHDLSRNGYSLDLLSLNEAGVGHRTIPDGRMKDILLFTLQKANQGIAHLTRSPASELPLDELAVSCEHTIHLLNQHLYSKAGLPLVVVDDGPKTGPAGA